MSAMTFEEYQAYKHALYCFIRFLAGDEDAHIREELNKPYIGGGETTFMKHFFTKTRLRGEEDALKFGAYVKELYVHDDFMAGIFEMPITYQMVGFILVSYFQSSDVSTRVIYHATGFTKEEYKEFTVKSMIGDRVL